MGYMGTLERDTPLLFFDIETAPMMGAEDWLDVGEAPANYKDPEKIAAYLEAARIKELDKVSLDLDLCRIVAIAWASPDTGVMVATADNIEQEKAALGVFWEAVRQPNVVLVGFNCLAFDLPVLVRRSQYLKIPVPYLNISKYRHPGIMDVMQILSFDGMVRARSQSFYCQRFGITAGADDTLKGADIKGAVERGEWDLVTKHVTTDVEKLRALYALVVGRGWAEEPRVEPKPLRERRACQVCNKVVTVNKTGTLRFHRCTDPQVF